MLKIFANHHTSKKVLVCCKKEDVKTIQSTLNNRLGGNWVWVDEMNPGEVLQFDDGEVYHGYDGRDGRFTKAVISIPV
jgi:hypothetical protein